MLREQQPINLEGNLGTDDIVSVSIRAERNKLWGLKAALLGVLVAVACRGQQLSPAPTSSEVTPTLTPTATETPTPTPTPNVAMYDDMREEDTNGDGIIGMLDLMDQRKAAGKECLEGENFKPDRFIDDDDVKIEQARLKRANLTGKYDRRADVNNDGINNSLDPQKIEADIGKPVPSNGIFRADDVERGWIANQVSVRFEPGTSKEANLVKLNNLYKNGGSETDIENTKKEILKSLGLDENWSVLGVLVLPAEITPEPFSSRAIVTLIVPPEVLKNMPLGEVIDMTKLKPDVEDVFRVYLATFP